MEKNDNDFPAKRFVISTRYAKIRSRERGFIMKRNCMIGQSGGPTVAINASLAGIIYEANKNQEFDKIYGAINGIKGLLEETYMDLTDKANDPKFIECLKYTPAMYLGSCRYKLPNSNDSTKPYVYLFNLFKKLEITDFFYIGGNDSMDTVTKLSKYAKENNIEMHFIGVPKTIDNDLIGTDHTPGFGSAAKYVATCMVEIIYDSMIYKVNSVTIVEVMGRHAGWLTAATALARNEQQEVPHLIYLPEVTFNKNSFIASIRELFKTKKNIIVAVSEGVKDETGNFLDAGSSYQQTDAFGNVLHSGTGKVLESLVTEEFNCKVRSIELNVLQRSAMHLASQTDIDESFMIGRKAIEVALNNETEKMMVMKRIAQYHIEYTSTDVSAIANKEKQVPIEWINKEGNNITKELYDYLFPLIQGEVSIPYENGIPVYLDISHLHYK